MTETEKTTTKKEEGKKGNPGIIIAICAAVVCIACVVIAIILGNGGGTKKAIVGSWKYSGLEAIYTFNEDGTCSYKFYDTERTCTYTEKEEGVIELMYDGDTLASTYKYHIEDGKTLHIEDSFGQDVVYERQ